MELIPQVRFYTYLHFYLPHPGSRRPSIRHKSIRLTLLFEKVSRTAIHTTVTHLIIVTPGQGKEKHQTDMNLSPMRTIPNNQNPNLKHFLYGEWTGTLV